MNQMIGLRETYLFAIAGTDYAFGMEWVAAAKSPATRANIPRQAALVRATHIAWRTRQHQVGFARIPLLRPAGLARRWRAAASAFADLPQPEAEPHSAIAAFAFQSGEIWVVAANHGRILPDGDRMFQDEPAAREHFQLLYEKIPRWGSLFAPAHWQYRRARDEGPLAFLALPKPDYPGARLLTALGWARAPGVPLAKIGKTLPNSFLWLGGLALVGLPLAIYAWRNSRAIPPPPPQMAISPAYPDIESPPERIALCVHAILTDWQRLATPGWDITEISCEGDSLAASLTAHATTPLSWLSAYHADAQLQSSSRTARLPLALAQRPSLVPLQPPFPSPDHLLDQFGRLDERIRGLNSFTNPAPPSDPPHL